LGNEALPRVPPAARVGLLAVLAGYFWVPGCVVDVASSSETGNRSQAANSNPTIGGIACLPRSHCDTVSTWVPRIAASSGWVRSWWRRAARRRHPSIRYSARHIADRCVCYIMPFPFLRAWGKERMLALQGVGAPQRTPLANAGGVSVSGNYSGLLTGSARHGMIAAFHPCRRK
jgi:hypothetical protein